MSWTASTKDKATRTLKALDSSRFQKLARIFSKTWHVTVSLNGHGCHTDGEHINIPANSDDLAAADQIILEGLLDHETAHVDQERQAKERQLEGVTCKTPMEMMKKAGNRAKAAKRKGEPEMAALPMMLNVFEDIRIEEAVAAQYPGIASNLRMVGEHYGRIYGEMMAKGQPVNPWQLIGSAIIFKAREQSTAWCPPEIVKALEVVADEIEDSHKQRSVEDAFALAIRTIEKIKKLVEDMKQEQEDREGGEGGEGDDETSGGPSDGPTHYKVRKAKDGEEAEGEPIELKDGDTVEFVDEDEDGEEGEGEGEEDGEGEAKGEAEGEGDKAEGEAKGEGEGEDEGASAGADGEGSEESGEASDPDSDSTEGKPSTPREFEDYERNPYATMSDAEVEAMLKALKGIEEAPEVDDLTDGLKKEIETKAREDALRGMSPRWIPDPAIAAQDKWAAPAKGSAAAYDRIREEVRGQISALRQKLMVQLMSQREARIERDRERGDIDNSALYGLRMGNKRVFTTRTKEAAVNTAVTILVDQSGSMAGGKMACAKRTAIALAETLDALQIPFEVIGFHNYYETRHGRPVITRKRTPGTTRWLPFEFDLYKTFDEKFKPVRTRFVNMKAGHENVDGEAVLQVARRLAQRSEPRKIMFVLSDGHPCGGADYSTAHWHLNEAVRKVAKAGIEIYGVGMQTESVRSYFNKENGSDHMVVNDMGTLAVRVFKLMRNKLTNGRRAA
jgi:cobalamin biosynthesis protein CobT